MVGNNLSLKAGTVCATCNNPDPCLQSVVVGEFDGVTHTWPVEPQIHLKVVDKGEGVKGWFSVESKCGKPDCPEATLVYDQTTKNIIAGIQNKEVLYFKSSTALSNNNLNIKDVWAYLNNMITPQDVFSEPKTYLLKVEGCVETLEPARFDVYPSISLYVETSFTYQLQGKERTWKERRDEHKKANLRMKKVKPKNGNKLRGGWTVHTDQFEITASNKIEVSYALNVCGDDFSKEVNFQTRKIRKVKTLEQISKVEKLVSNIQNHLLPDPNSSVGSREAKLLKFEFDPISMSVSYAFERLDGFDSTTHYLGIDAQPFVKLLMRLDIIQMVAAYAKVDKIVAKFRELVKKNASIKTYLELQFKSEFALGAAYKHKEWSFDFGEKNRFSATLLGVIGADINTKGVIFDVSLKAEGSARTAIGLSLDQHDDGLDLVGYHDGIVADIMLYAQWGTSTKRGSNPTTIMKYDNREKVVLAAPLNINESAVRVNIFGKERRLQKRTVTPAKPWAMGYNHIHE